MKAYTRERRAIAQHIGARVRLGRVRKGMTQQELADATDTARRNVSRLENGKHAPCVFTLLNVARALELPTAFFLEGL